MDNRSPVSEFQRWFGARWGDQGDVEINESDLYNEARAAFEAGAASRQGEVDRLKAELQQRREEEAELIGSSTSDDLRGRSVDRRNPIAPAIRLPFPWSGKRVLVACEFSGIVRDAFIQRGHVAVSCDLLPSERPGPHIVGDIRDIDLSYYDLLIAHPPCTYLAVSGARWLYEKPGRAAMRDEAREFVRWLMAAPVPAIAIENPISVISSQIRKPDQIVQPWMFGHGETKATCLWLKGLPKLTPTKVVYERKGRVWLEPPSPDRWKNRSRTFEGFAAAMADQWGAALSEALAA